jgi:REP element-mobilizing transposase RayT
MGRQCRIQQVGGIYHVIQRGNNKKYVLEKDEDKGFLINQVKKYKSGLGYKIYGFVIMDNHYHFIIQTFEQPLQKIMHRWNSNYSKYYNEKYAVEGHVFQSRYKSVFVQDEKYLLALLRYIHNNPIRAGIANTTKDYKWSSDVFYRRKIQDGLVDIGLILQMLSPLESQSIINYKKYMCEESKESQKEYEEKDVLGDEAYIIMTKTMGLRKQRKALQEILNETGINLEEKELLKQGSRSRRLTKYKLQYILSARQINYTLHEIGEFIGMDRGGIYNLIQRYHLKC